MNLHSVPTAAPTAAKRVPHPADMHVGRSIRARRKELGLSQEKLAERMVPPITFQQIQKYENGSNRVGPSRLTVIAKVLEVPIDYFFPPESTATPMPPEPNPLLKLLPIFVKKMRALLDEMEAAARP